VYAIQAMPAWLTACAVSAKTQLGFTIQFGTPSNVATSVDWLLVR
jgi:hypothetical protein